MKARDVIDFAAGALRGYRMRSLLMLLAMAIGVAAVVVLTSLGEGARRYVANQFSALGTNLLIVLPGRSETAGASPATLLGETPRDLTLDDARALERSRHIRRVAPVSLGTSVVSWRSRERDSVILGSSAEFLPLRHWNMAQGRFLPAGDLDNAEAVCVIGENVRRELFGMHRALGEWLRIGEYRFRVIGILESKGQSIGVNTKNLIMIPVASAQQIFNNPSLFRILVEARSREAMPLAKRDILDIIRDRHQGEEDITVITQDAVLATFDRIFSALTYTVGGIAAISLAVAGILIMNVMLVAVTQRTAEIGLLKALGAPGRHILLLFVAEAALLSAAGAVIGMALGQLGSYALRTAFPELPAWAPWWASLAAIGTAMITGVLFSLLPARRAARLDPVMALARRQT